MSFTVSINGPVNAGKTTQITLLPSHWSIAIIGSLHEYDDTLREMLETGKMEDWWWSCSDQEFVGVIFTALSRRFAAASIPGSAHDVIIFDRGTDMFLAVAVATCAVKNHDCNLDAARESVYVCLSDLGFEVETEDVCILLKQNQDRDMALKIGLDRETSHVNERYRQYQTLLHFEIGRQEEMGIYHHVVVEQGEKSHRQVQDQIRAALADRALREVFVPLMGSMSRIYALGGLSESGKSTIAAYISGFYGQPSHRHKMGYFLDLASRKQGRDIYSLPERDQAFALCGELHAYLQAHYWVKQVTIESVHRFESIRWLKQILGDKLCIVYVDVSLEKRKLRSSDALATLEEMDVKKTQRGADRVKDIADYILSNNESLRQSQQRLQRYTLALDRKAS